MANAPELFSIRLEYHLPAFPCVHIFTNLLDAVARNDEDEAIVIFIGLAAWEWLASAAQPRQYRHPHECRNGVLASPVMVILTVLVRRPKVMGKLVVTGPRYGFGRAATAAMALRFVGMAATMFMSTSS